MKPKKKPTVSNKKTPKKSASHKPLLLVEKTVITTKQKTHNTIQDPAQIKDNNTHVHTPRSHLSRFLCIEKLEQCNLSPFSSPGGSSRSPRGRKASPIVKEEKEKKRLKEKLIAQGEKLSEKKKNFQQKRQAKGKLKAAKEQCNITYQNFVMKRLDERKITERSEESEISISKVSKVSKLQLNILIPKQKTGKLAKNIKIKELKQKIFERYRRELSSLKPNELNFYCSVVLIQRLWRQNRIKNFINEFITPRSNTETQRQNNLSKLQTTGISQQQTSQLLRKYHHQSYIFQKKNILADREIHSTEIETAKKDIQKMDLKDLQLSCQLSPQKEKKMMRFIQCVRDINFTKSAQSNKKYKINVFNLESSLSEKCLMQSFYLKVFKNSPIKMKNFDLLSSKKEQQQIQRSIQMINTIKTPEKIELIDIQERFQTQLRSEELSAQQTKQILIVKPTQKAQAGVNTEFEQEQQSRQIKSLKDLNSLSEEIMYLVLTEFCEEFHSFTSRSILRKKKKNRLPGLKVTLNTIADYLSGLTTYMLQNYETEVIRRFNLMSPLSFLKIHHQYDDQQQIDQEDEQFNMPIIPNTLFYEYQLIYQDQVFKISQQDRKFSNFLQSLIKIQNLLLSNCLSQILQKTRIDKVVLPWDRRFDASRYKKDKLSKKSFEAQLKKITKIICESAFTKVGAFYKRLDDPTEQQKLLKSISLQYKSEGSEWSAQYEYLELRMDLTKHVEEIILEQLTQDLMIFF